MVSDNSGLQWVENRLLFKGQRITQAGALLESARYLCKYYNQPVENLAGKGNDFQKDLLTAGNALAANILRTLSVELALKAVYEWENNKAADKKHKLLDLWKLLSSQSQSQLESGYLHNYRLYEGQDKAKEWPIVRLLEEFNDAFHESRYFNEPNIFKPGDQNLHITKLDFVVLAAWEMISTDIDMIPKIFDMSD